MSVPAHIEALRALLQPTSDGKRRLLSVPGCWDGLTALMIEQAGFEAAFLTGGGLAMARFGRPDMGLVAMSQVTETIEIIRDRVNLPLIVDGDTGFGNALNVAATVRAFERAGASVIQIEDQTSPKRCGHMAGKAVVSSAEMIGKVKAAVDARENTLISARTDAASVEGIDAALDRAEAYLEAGADFIFVEGPATFADTARVGAQFGGRVPLVHNLVEGGVTATKSGAELEAMGFAVALHPLLLLHGFAARAPNWLSVLRDNRSTEALEPEIATLQHMNGIVGARALIDEGARYGEVDL